MSPHPIIDEMPTMRDVEQADPRQLVAWHLYLRPTMMNEELDIVKAIARRVDALPQSVREAAQEALRR